MHLRSHLFAALFCCAATVGEAAGLKLIDISADAEGPALTGAAWYPCAAPAAEVRLRSIVVPALKDCPVVGEKLPLIIISHGTVGWFGGHHDTAAALADAGFVVAAISQPGDTWSDTSRVGDLAILFDRPISTKRLIDYMTGAWPDQARIDAGAIGFFGFSRGGYTGLVAVGADPDLRKAADLCLGGSEHPACDKLRNQERPSESPIHEVRIKAAVIADPAFGRLLDRDSLNGVKAPLQLWASERGGDGVSLELVSAIQANLPSKPDYRVVPNAGHFAFAAPCSPLQVAAAPKVCVDANGFDRVAFHKQLNAAVLEFFRKHLIEDPKP
jgi:predicted dienelactone hydrolase